MTHKNPVLYYQDTQNPCVLLPMIHKNPVFCYQGYTNILCSITKDTQKT